MKVMPAGVVAVVEVQVAVFFGDRQGGFNVPTNAFSDEKGFADFADQLFDGRAVAANDAFFGRVFDENIGMFTFSDQLFDFESRAADDTEQPVNFSIFIEALSASWANSTSISSLVNRLERRHARRTISSRSRQAWLRCCRRFHRDRNP